MPKEIAGYHFKSSDDGMIAIQCDEPYEGAVTVTWRPNEFPGPGFEAVIPQDLFARCAASYLRELNADKLKERLGRTEEPAKA